MPTATKVSTFSYVCSCGDVMNVEASSRKEAIGKMRAMLTKSKIEQHYADKHPDEVVPLVKDVHESIDQNIVEAKEPL